MLKTHKISRQVTAKVRNIGDMRVSINAEIHKISRQATTKVRNVIGDMRVSVNAEIHKISRQITTKVRTVIGDMRVSVNAEIHKGKYKCRSIEPIHESELRFHEHVIKKSLATP